MKKFYVLFLLLLTTHVGLYAKSALKVTSGNICEVLKDNAQAIVQVDYSVTTWDDERSYEEFCGEEYEARVSNSNFAFTSAFNTHNPALKINNFVVSPKYIIVVRPINLDRSLNLMTGQASIEFSGVIDIYDTTTESVVLHVKVDEFEGDCDYVPNDRLNKCFAGLAEELVKLTKKCR